MDASEILEPLRLNVPNFCAVAAFWPVQPDRARAYLHLLDGRGRAIGFVKLANRKDSSALDRERTALELFAGDSAHFAAPRLESFGLQDTTQWLRMEPLPPIGRQTHNPRQSLPVDVIEEIRGESRLVPAAELGTLSWWADLQDRLPDAPSAFVADLDAAVSEGVVVGRCHGDFGAHNTVVASGRFWVFDWEAYAPDAPIDQDASSFRLVRGDAPDVIAGPPSGIRFRQFVTCCAFGLAHDVPAFRKIVANWKGTRGT